MTAALAYSQNARPVGFPISYELTGDRLHIDNGRKTSEVRLGAVESVRLTYEPRGLAQRSYRTSLTLRDGRKVSFSSVTWRSMVEVRPQDAAYRAFTLALVAAVARANPEAAFLAGRSRAAWLALAGLTGLILLALALFTWRAFAAGAATAGVVGLAVAGLGVWQLEPMLRLNQPRRFTADAPPAELLP